MPSAEDIKARIEAAIPSAHAEVEDYTGGGDHFRATVVSETFAGRSRIQQHKLVYEVFGEEIGGAIHALSLKTEASPGTQAEASPGTQAEASPGTQAEASPHPQADEATSGAVNV